MAAALTDFDVSTEFPASGGDRRTNEDRASPRMHALRRDRTNKRKTKLDRAKSVAEPYRQSISRTSIVFWAGISAKWTAAERAVVLKAAGRFLCGLAAALYA